MSDNNVTTANESDMPATADRIELRDEQPGDEAAIAALTTAAFAGRPYAGGDEAEVIERLRVADSLTVSLVAVQDARIIGQITFSPAHCENDDHAWYALGPVSVLPQWQLRGVGTLLIEAGLRRIAELGAAGCILTGNPDYYQRFGFEVRKDLAPDNEPAEYFQLRKISGDEPGGTFAFHPSFYNAESPGDEK